MNSCLPCLYIAVVMRDLYDSVCVRDAYLESSGESAQVWCTNFNAKITGSMDTDYSMRFKAVFGHFHDLRARPDLHHVMPFKPCISFEQHVSGCSLSKFRADASTCKKELRRPAAKLQNTAECVRSGFQPKCV